MNKHELLDPETLAAKLGISVYSVYRLTKLRRIEHVKLSRFIRFRPEVVERYLQERTVSPCER